MTTTHILGDHVPRKSNFDPLLAEKLTRYYAEHPEELEKPIPQIVASNPVRKYFPMAQTEGHALGLQALQEQCTAENNQNHPQFTLPNGRKIYRPLTFKENIQARVENYETTRNPDGSERTLDERLSLITESWYDSCTAIVYKAGTTKFKIVPISEHLITLDPDFYENFLDVKYDAIDGTELDSNNKGYDTNIDNEAVQNHEGWLAAVEDDRALLKSYTNIIFAELKRKDGRTKGMKFIVRKNTPSDRLLDLMVCDLNCYSYADGDDYLDYACNFLRRSPLLDTSSKK